MEEMIECPKCKGCGEVKKPKTRSKRKICGDPSKKWCCKCSNFVSLELFGNKPNNLPNAYCRDCESNITHKKYHQKRFKCICVVCKKEFNGGKSDSKTCSYFCRNDRKRSKAMMTLPNYLIDSFRGKY